jgi:hypothetical protein
MYRLTVCPSNFLDAAHLERPALLLGYRPEGSPPVAERLLNDFLFHCGRSAELLYELIAETEQRGSTSTGGSTGRGGATAGQSPQVA